MELSKDIRQADMGIIAEDWDIVSFADIADKKIRWSLTGGPFGSNLKASEYTDEGVRIIQLQNIGDGIFLDDYAIFTSEQKADDLISCNIYPGEIILSKMGDPVARACFVPTIDQRYLMASDGIRLAVDRNRFDKKFVHDYINFTYFRKKVIKSSTGSTRQRISLQDLKKLPFIAPSLSEQRAIAATLSDVDALLATLNALIAKKRAIKQGVMQELLTGKIRLSGFTGKWDVKHLVNECELITKGTTPTTLGKSFTTHGINFVKIESITDEGDIIIDKLAFIDDETNHMLKRSQLREKDILFSIAGALGRTAIVKQNLLPANTNQALALIRLRPCSELDHNYLLNYLRSTFIQKHIETINVQAAQANLSLENVRDFDIKFPSISEQRAITAVLSDMCDEISALEQQREKTRLLKQGMMQELLTGKTRLL